MKKHYLLLISLFVSSLNQAQIITFGDPVFKAKLLESDASNFIARDLNGDYFAIDANNDNEIEVAEASQVAFLEINDSSISSLNGIDNFVNLVSLRCQNNQINGLNVSGLLLLTYLDCTNNQLNFLNINGLTELEFLDCSFNSLTNLNASEITNLTALNCSNNALSTLNLNNLINLELLNCSNNQIQIIDLNDLVSLKNLNCSSNIIDSINTTQLVSLEQLNCSFNSLSNLTITNLNLLTSIECTNNLLTQLNILNSSNLITLTCNNNLLTTLNLSGFLLLESVSCQNNQLVDINTTGLTNLSTLNCDFNQLQALDLNTLSDLRYLSCNNNQLTSITFLPLNLIQVVSCNTNLISTINSESLSNLQSFYCSNNQITSLDFSNSSSLQSLFCSSNLLTHLFIKNGSNESNLQFFGNPNLSYICADDIDLEYVQSEVVSNGYNCSVNTYCTFVPGGTYYAIEGNTKLDINSNGCDSFDGFLPNLKFSLSNGISTEVNFANASGNYSKLVNSGSYSLTPMIENPNYFLISPTDILVEFPFDVSPFNQSFCVTPNGSHADLEIVIFPISSLISTGNPKYIISYKNKGTISQSGSISLNFNDENLDFASSTPTITSQTTNNLNWDFLNLAPFESRKILLELNSNMLSVGQLIPFLATITSINTDENPNDNSCALNQTVVATLSSNEKNCIEGTSISTSQVGEYIHYSIRFQNLGTTTAQNMVVKDVIDPLMFDVSTIIPLDSSHNFTTRISSSSQVEFVFENINLSNINTNEGYIVFKIKTLPTLPTGFVFSNTASIYFNYEEELETNTESTIIQALETNEYLYSNELIIVPNPVSNSFRITNKTNKNTVVNKLEIYNSTGQLVYVIANPLNDLVDVSFFKTGIYIVKVSTEKGEECIRFSKKQ